MSDTPLTDGFRTTLSALRQAVDSMALLEEPTLEEVLSGTPEMVPELEMLQGLMQGQLLALHRIKDILTVRGLLDGEASDD